MKRKLSTSKYAVASRRYRAKHRERVRAANRAYYERNAKKCNARTSAWKQNNPAYAETQRRWRAKNKNYMKRYYWLHRDHILAMNRKRNELLRMR